MSINSHKMPIHFYKRLDNYHSSYYYSINLNDLFRYIDIGAYIMELLEEIKALEEIGIVVFIDSFADRLPVLTEEVE